jgi:hypothetical protein
MTLYPGTAIPPNSRNESSITTSNPIHQNYIKMTEQRQSEKNQMIIKSYQDRGVKNKWKWALKILEKSGPVNTDYQPPKGFDPKKPYKPKHAQRDKVYRSQWAECLEYLRAKREVDVAKITKITNDNEKKRRLLEKRERQQKKIDQEEYIEDSVGPEMDFGMTLRRRKNWNDSTSSSSNSASTGNDSTSSSSNSASTGHDSTSSSSNSASTGHDSTSSSSNSASTGHDSTSSSSNSASTGNDSTSSSSNSASTGNDSTSSSSSSTNKTNITPDYTDNVSIDESHVDNDTGKKHNHQTRSGYTSNGYTDNGYTNNRDTDNSRSLNSSGRNLNNADSLYVDSLGIYIYIYMYTNVYTRMYVCMDI